MIVWSSHCFNYCVVDLIGGATCFAPNGIIDPLYHNAIDGLMMVLTDSGDFIYISDNVLYILGLEQVFETYFVC